VAYLPIDPRDIGRDYQAVIRVNSQSGKGGMAFLLERDFGISLPRWMMLELAPYVQAESERRSGELTSAQIREMLFRHFERSGPLTLVDYSLERSAEGQSLSATVMDGDRRLSLKGHGNGAMSAFINAWQAHSGTEIAVTDYNEHALTEGSDADAIAFVQVRTDGPRVCAVAEDSDTVSASLKAIISAINLAREAEEQGVRDGLTELAV